MEIIFKSIKVNYIIKNSGENAIVFLHGWGGSIDSFIGVSNAIDDYKQMHILIDFPPFGNSQEPITAWTLSDYAQCVNEILEKENIKKITIVSHSFGGRVAIYLANLYTNKVQKNNNNWRRRNKT